MRNEISVQLEWSYELLRVER